MKFCCLQWEPNPG